MYRRIISFSVVLIAFLIVSMFIGKVNASSQVQTNSLDASQAVTTSMQSNLSSPVTTPLDDQSRGVADSNSVSSVGNSSVTRTNSTVIQSVNNVSTSSANIGTTEILNILLIAVGVIIILLAIAILIRLK